MQGGQESRVERTPLEVLNWFTGSDGGRPKQKNFKNSRENEPQLIPVADGDKAVRVEERQGTEDASDTGGQTNQYKVSLLPVLPSGQRSDHFSETIEATRCSLNKISLDLGLSQGPTKESIVGYADGPSLVGKGMEKAQKNAGRVKRVSIRPHTQALACKVALTKRKHALAIYEDSAGAGDLSLSSLTHSKKGRTGTQATLLDLETPLQELFTLRRHDGRGEQYRKKIVVKHNKRVTLDNDQLKVLTECSIP